jgi:hypothetical protein
MCRMISVYVARSCSGKALLPVLELNHARCWLVGYGVLRCYACMHKHVQLMREHYGPHTVIAAYLLCMLCCLNLQ